ncbi:MAG: O-antigen ligase family protein [Firmicutes bacterium]|nr:O-antigen ligase family protein [Bacillota bacterium]
MLGDKSFPRYSYVLVALLALVIVLATIFSAAQATILSVTLRSLFLLLMACGLSILLPCTTETLSRLCFCLGLAGTIASAVALAGIVCLNLKLNLLAFAITNPNYMYGLPEVQSFFGNPNGLGMFLVFSIAGTIVLFALLRSRKETNGLRVPSFYFILAIQLVTLVLTFSRAALIALSLFVLCFIWHNNRRYCYTPLVLLSAAVLVSKQAFEKSSIVEIVRALANGRVQLWAEGLQLFKQYPLFGTGLGGWFAITGNPLTLHNTYIHVAVELGLVGLALYLIYSALFMQGLRETMKKAAEGSSRYILSSGLYSLCIGLLVHQFFESYLYHGLPLFLLVMIPLHTFMREPGTLYRFRETVWEQGEFPLFYRRVS